MTRYSKTNLASAVLRDDGAFIPADPANADWQAYQAWLAAGGVPDPAAVPSAIIRTAPGDKLIAALTDDQAKTIKLRDLLRIAARETLPETSPVLARAGKAAGTTPKDWIDAAFA